MIVTHHFSHICTRVMVPWFKQKFLSAQYLENKLTEFHKFYKCTHIDMIYYTSIFAHLYQSYGHWFTPEFCFRSISLEQIDRISQNFIMHSYCQDLAWDCYTSFFTHLYQSYGHWFTPEFCFYSISWEQIDRISPNFIYALIFTRSRSAVIFAYNFVTKLWSLI